MNTITIISFDNYNIDIDYDTIKNINYLYLLIENKQDIYENKQDIYEKINLSYKYCTLFNLKLILNFFNNKNYNIDNLNIQKKKELFLCANYLDIPDYLKFISNNIINIYI
jgi:hypothetical protein